MNARTYSRNEMLHAMHAADATLATMRESSFTRLTYDRELYHVYSSEKVGVRSGYLGATAPLNAQGPKWSAKKYSNGIRASATNERYRAMRDAELDRRPFAGAPYDPRNTFSTTGPIRHNYKINSTGRYMETLTDGLLLRPESAAAGASRPVTAPMPRCMTLSQLLSTI